METILNQTEAFYAILNKFVSQGAIPLLDAAYPHHDGNQDAEVVSDMMLLRDRLSAISRLCLTAIDYLNSAIDTDQE